MYVNALGRIVAEEWRQSEEIRDRGNGWFIRFGGDEHRNSDDRRVDAWWDSGRRRRIRK